MRSFIFTALVAAATVLLPATPAQAADTCFGQTPTITSAGGDVHGTPGRDVIVVTPTVRTLIIGDDGDDDICVVGGNIVEVFIDSGAGNDRIDASTGPVGAGARLGAGADLYLGSNSSYSDSVEVSPDQDRDVVKTFGGNDFVDANDTGGGDELDLGHGDDTVTFTQIAGAAGSKIDLGRGDDRLTVDDRQVDSTVDLRKKRLITNGVRSSLNGVEDVLANGKNVLLRGDGDKNDMYVTACHVTMYGGAGSDTLWQLGNEELDYPCGRQWARLYGQKGNDSMKGRSGDDILIGGDGKDVAIGLGGRDTCVAERVRC